ncbi:hypothetical protein LAZ67_16002975 [Cordylochernes scorpioides]|uniref:Reverse transcriptase domain-containing protein n=1 Tax=Cordylochernes scorpioides TaxID=51811 RepID=A0ABY6LDC2_9ARAC|nr:hypothetical protein LAZ67_16002975 [Cordylochernes scorpioides]
MNFRVATINARGLATRGRILVLCHLLRQHQVDIAFVQETNSFHLDQGQDLCLGYSAVVTPPVAISGSGLSCVFGPGVAVLRQRVLWPGHIALAVIDVHGEEMTIFNAHLAHDPRERLEQLELLAATAIQERAWVLGDLNIREPSSSSADALAALLDLAALVDVATQFDAAHLPTRVASRDDQIESSRLERILVPAGVLDRVTTYATSHYHLSDHRLVLLQVGPPAVSPHQPRLAAMLRSGLALEHLAGCIRELDEDLAHDDDDGTLLWDRWTTIKAGLLAEARSLHDPRHAASDGYVVRARGYIAAQLEASSIRADYPSLPDLARAIHLRRPVSVIRDDDDNVIEGPELRRKAYAIFQPRFARPTSDPAAGAAFIGTSMITPISELGEEDPLHRPEICPSEIAAAIRRLPRGKAPGWDGLPCELLAAFEDFFAEALARVFAASRLRGALPPSTQRSSICLVPKARGGRGLDGYRPIALPSTEYRVLAAISTGASSPTYAPWYQTARRTPSRRSPSWNIARVTDAVEEATAMGSPLAVMGVDLESAFDSLDRSFLRQGCAVSAALFSIATEPLLRRLELTLGVGNVIAYADDIVLLLHRDEEFERVATVLEDFKRASGIAVNLGKSAGLWCGAWRNRGDSPLGASWSTTSIRVLGLDIAPKSSVAHQEQHLLALLESACRRWTPFTRGLSLVGRARAANSLVGSTIQHHLHGYLPSPPDHRQAAGPTSEGVPVALRGGRNGFGWLVASSSEAWIRPPPDGTRLQPRHLRLLKLWEEASKILSLNHRAVPISQLLDIPIIGGCRFLRPPDLLAPARWLGVRVRDFLAEDRHIAHPTRSALADAAALGAFCRRLTAENDEGFREPSLAAAVVLRGMATPFLNGLTTRSARRALDRPRLAATPISRFLARWAPTISPPSRIDWASLRRCAFSGHEADAPHQKGLNIIGRPPDLQAWIFGGSGLEDDALTILASAKLRVYRHFVQKYVEFKKLSYNYKMYPSCHLTLTQKYSAAYLIRVIAILLIIGGVELNPGPPTKKQTTLSTVRTPETKEVMEDDLKSIVIQIHTELRILGARLETRLQNIEQKFDEWDQRLTVIETSQKTCLELATKNDLRIKSLEDHGDMLDRKTRENNLIFYGIIGSEAENSDETLCKLVTAINEKMQIQIESEIMRCHRLSKKANAPILVEIPKQTTRIALLRNSYKLRDDKFFVNKDYTLKTREQRRLLITKKKELSEKGIHSKLRDNKLLANGQKYEVVEDLTSVYLPEFGDVHLLMYADDIAIIGESRVNLQKKINILKEYLGVNYMTLNESKSKVMVFRNGGHCCELTKKTGLIEYVGKTFRKPDIDIIFDISSS